jgi:hypothetical protein
MLLLLLLLLLLRVVCEFQLLQHEALLAGCCLGLCRTSSSEQRLRDD